MIDKTSSRCSSLCRQSSNRFLTQLNKVINQHIHSGFRCYSKFACEKVENPLKLYGDEDCAEMFCDYISNEARSLYHMFPEKPMKPLT